MENNSYISFNHQKNCIFILGHQSIITLQLELRIYSITEVKF